MNLDDEGSYDIREARAIRFSAPRKGANRYDHARNTPYEKLRLYQPLGLLFEPGAQRGPRRNRRPASLHPMSAPIAASMSQRRLDGCEPTTKHRLFQICAETATARKTSLNGASWNRSAKKPPRWPSATLRETAAESRPATNCPPEPATLGEAQYRQRSPPPLAPVGDRHRSQQPARRASSAAMLSAPEQAEPPRQQRPA